MISVFAFPALSQRLTAWGFDLGKLGFSLRTALGAAFAMICAWVLGLDHPQWAAISVWAAAQPLRGQLLEKSLFRAIGTVFGTGAGVALVFLGAWHPAALVLALALWVAACTLGYNLQRGLVSYGFVLAGYTAAMVALLGPSQPDTVMALAFDRFATVFLGILIAALIGLIFAPRSNQAPLRLQIMALLAQALAQRAADPDLAQEAQILSQIGAIDEQLDPHGAGSRQARLQIRSHRKLLLAIVDLLLPQPVQNHLRPSPDQAALAPAIALLQQGDAMAAARALQPLDPALAAHLQSWAIAQTASSAAPHDSAAFTLPVILHRDWIGATEASLRAFIALIAVGGFWLATGWSSGHLLLLGMAVMISIFSSFENPVSFMRWVVLGQIFGVSAMLICRWLIWPYMGGEAMQILALFPFIMLGGLLSAHRRSLLLAFDYNMLLLLLSQPHFPLQGSFGQSLMLVLGMLLAPVLAWGLYLTLFPANLGRRIQSLQKMMQHDLMAMAKAPAALAQNPHQRRHWRARFYHRLLRLIRMSERAGHNQTQTLHQGLETLEAGRIIAQLQARRGDPNLSKQERLRLDFALTRAARFDQAPARALQALRRATLLAPQNVTMAPSAVD